MPPLTNLDRLYRAEFRQIWSDFQGDRRAQAEAASMELLLQPTLSRAHRAGCHLVLAYSDDQYVEHAIEAVKGFHELFEDAINTMEQRNTLKELEDIAKTALQMALNRAAEQDEELSEEVAAMVRGLDGQSAGTADQANVNIVDEDYAQRSVATEASVPSEEKQESGEVDDEEEQIDQASEIDPEEIANLEARVAAWTAEDKAAKAEKDAMIAASQRQIDSAVNASAMDTGGVEEPAPVDRAAMRARIIKEGEEAMKRQDAYLASISGHVTTGTAEQASQDKAAQDSAP